MDVTFLEPGSPVRFPDPRRGAPEGLVAVGGDLSIERLLAAYDQGIFPWYSEFELPLWWSPDPRAVLEEGAFHVSRSLQRSLRRREWTLTFDGAFDRVIRECAAERREGTWILPEIIAAYEELHALGHAHSFEVWDADGELIGGIYGVRRGALFAAESKFHRRADASKVALLVCHRSLFRAGIGLFDVQLSTPYLAGLGVREIPRRAYLERLEAALTREVDLSGLEPAI
ncbi:MAG: leucyl/phenylalanyl-tRNA--protein transferase [Planctomycetota bacterium]